MQQWEYRTVFVSEVRERQENLAELIGTEHTWETAFNQTMNKFGGEGWELVQIFISSLPLANPESGIDQPVAIFKKQLKDT